MADPIVVVPAAPAAPNLQPAAAVSPAAAAPAAAPAAPAAATIVAEPVVGAEPVTTVAPSWREDWRETIAKGDDKKLKQLQRYASPEAFADAGFALRQKMSSGELKAGLAADATPEQVAEWRRDNGIPEKAEGYDTALPNGLVIGEQDKPLIGKFLTAMHAKNASPDLVKTALATYYEVREAEAAQRGDNDRAQRASFEDELRAEMGGEFRPNMNAIKNLLAAAPEGVADQILGGRTADGVPLGNHPGVIRWLAGLAREVNPAATVVPAGGSQGVSIADEIASIEKTMRTDRKAYNADEKMQARFRQLVEAREKIAKRG